MRKLQFSLFFQAFHNNSEQFCSQVCPPAHTEQKEPVWDVASLYYLRVKSRELTAKQILSVPCPTCGAAMKEVCELNTGAPRTEPHRDRKLNAAEAIEARRAKR